MTEQYVAIATDEHQPGCWRLVGHHHCAVSEVERLNGCLAELGTEYHQASRQLQIVERELAACRESSSSQRRVIAELRRRLAVFTDGEAAGVEGK